MKHTREELLNTLTHLGGTLLMPVVLVLLLHQTKSSMWQYTFSILVFSISAILMYASSTIYHWALPGRLKRILRYFDHINIYILIAASYTPILLCAVGGTTGWVMFGVMWGIALLGTFYKIFFLGKYPRLSLGIYLTMGWSGVFVVKPVWDSLPATALWCLLAEGFFYTMGSYFFSRDGKHKYYHAIWHLFVLGGTLSHFAAVWFFLK